MKLLVTGGAGFIGSAVIRHIINNTNHSVTNTDKLDWTLDETFAIGIKKIVKWLENIIWCDEEKDGSYQCERLGVVKS